MAETSGGRITGSVKYFKSHPDDFGAMVHETVHTIQGLPRPRQPRLAGRRDRRLRALLQVRTGQERRPVDPDRSHYDGSYRVTATFLNFVAEKYDKELVRKLNVHMREGKYSDDLFKELTGKTLKELDEEWRASLKK